MTADQPSLPFPPRRTRALPFIEGASNAEASSRLAAWRAGLADPARPLAVVAAITGAGGTGKTMLLEREAEGFGVPVRREGADFEALLEDGASAVAVDDAHELDPLALFAVIEAAARARTPLILAGAGRLTGWAGPRGEGGGAHLPDLESRLRSVVHASLEAPDEAMLAQVLAADLARRGLKLPFAPVADAASHLRREFAAAAGFAALVEAHAGRRYRRAGPLLRDALAEAAAFTL